MFNRLLFFLFIGPLTFSQIVFGEVQKKTEQVRNVRAVIVGVRKYKNLSSKLQLDYADRDAMQFKNSLIANGVDPSHIAEYINETATGPSIIIDKLRGFLSDSKEDDLVIFYFSGHGDVQLDYEEPTGFLLLHNVKSPTATTYSKSDAINIDDLKYITKKPARGGRNVLIIIDACRKNKLVTGDDKARAVSEALNRWEEENVYRLISCKPDQTSFEDENFKHGVFTYYLLKGLKGEADELDISDTNNKIEFMEMSSYLVSRVKKATKNQQTPETEGDDSFYLLNTIPEFELADYDVNKELGKSKGILDGIDVPVQLRVKNYYFQRALEEGEILRPLFEPEPKKEPFQVLDVRRKTVHTKNANALAFNSKGDKVATIGPDDQIKLWDANSMELIDKKNYKGGGLCVEISPDDRYIVGGTWFTKIHVWDLVNDRFFDVPGSGHKDDVRVLKFSSDGRYLASSGNDKEIIIWNTSDWKEAARLSKEHTSEVFGLGFQEETGRLVSIDKSQMVIWDLKTQTPMIKLPGKAEYTAFHMSFDQQKAYFLDKEGHLFSYDLPKNQLRNEGNIQKNSSALMLDLDEEVVITGGANNPNLTINSIKESEVLKAIKNGRGIRQVDISANREKIGASLFGGTMLVSDVFLPREKLFATELFEQMSQSGQFEKYRSKLASSLVASIEKINQPILERFIAGEENLPSHNKVKEAIRRQQYALKLKKDDEWFFKRLNTDLLLLEVFEIITSNNFEALVKAEQNLKDIIVLDPYEAYTHNTLSKVYRKLNELSKAKESASIAGEKIPYWVEPKLSLALTSLQERKYQEAINQYKEAFMLDSTSTKCLNLYSDIFLLTGNYKAAENLINQSLKLEPENVYTLNRKGHLATARGDFETAEDILFSSISVDSTINDSFKEIGYLYEQWFYATLDFRYFNLAERYYNNVVESNPSDLSTIARRATLFINLLGYGLADKELLNSNFIAAEKRKNSKLNVNTIALREIFRHAKYLLSKNRIHPEILNIYGYAEHLSPEKDNPEERFKRSMKLNASDPSATFNYGVFLNLNGRQKKTVKLLEGWMNQKGSDLDIVLLLAESYVKVGKHSNAIDLLNQAKKDYPMSPLIEYQMSKVLLSNGVTSFKNNARLSLKNDPEFRFSKEIIQNPKSKYKKFNEPIIKEKVYHSFY